MKFHCIVFFVFVLFSIPSFCQTGNENQQENNFLPLIKTYKLAVPSNPQFKENVAGDIHFANSSILKSIPAPFFSDSLATASSLDFIKTNLGETPGELVVEKVSHFSKEEEKTDCPTGSVKAITFSVFYNHIRLNGYYAQCYFSGQSVNEAYFKLPGKIEIVTKSTKEIINKEKAIQVFEDSAEKAFHKKYHADNIELIYAWYPIDNIQNGMDFSIAFLRPNWLITFSHGSELLVDAFDGKLWRDD